MSVLPAVVAATTTMVLLWGLLRSRLSAAIQDVPNARSLHATSTPRIGGIGLLAGVVTGWMLCAEAPAWWVLLPLLGLVIVSLLDDVRGMPVQIRLVVHLAAAALLVIGSGLWSGQGGIVGLLMVFITVWMTNLFNFMDGADGLAGGMALFGFLFCGLAAQQEGSDVLAMQCFVVSAAAAGFLCFNFPPARVFMGDAGSIPLGFLVCALGFAGWQQGVWTPWFPLLVFSPFVMDATVTLIRRTLRGARITEAHREHYYQRAVQMGHSHLKVALWAYVWMFAAGASALWVGEQAMGWLLAAWLAVYAVAMFALDRRWKRLMAGPS